MPKIKTLNEIGDLRSSGYGRPWPRHGLHLLHWFCYDYVSFDNNGDIEVSVDPKFEEYGFHHFANYPQDDGERLLPCQSLPYFEVGNLAHKEADDLPEYVTSNFDEENSLSNKDRIIISLNPDLTVDKVYVTQHLGRSSFDPQNTFRISKGLVRILSNQELEDDLLWEVDYMPNSIASPVWPVIPQAYQHPSPVAPSRPVPPSSPLAPRGPVAPSSLVALSGPVALSPLAQVNLTSEGDYRQQWDNRDVSIHVGDSRPKRICTCNLL